MFNCVRVSYFYITKQNSAHICSCVCIWFIFPCVVCVEARGWYCLFQSFSTVSFRQDRSLSQGPEVSSSLSAQQVTKICPSPFPSTGITDPHKWTGVLQRFWRPKLSSSCFSSSPFTQRKQHQTSQTDQIKFRPRITICFHIRILGLAKSSSLHPAIGLLFLQMDPLRCSEWTSKLGSDVWGLLSSQQNHKHWIPLHQCMPPFSCCSVSVAELLVTMEPLGITPYQRERRGEGNSKVLTF